MKNTYILFIIFAKLCITNTTAMDQKTLEDYRPGKVYQEVDIKQYPICQSASDCLQLCSSLIRSDIEFWQEAQQNLIDSSERLPIIVKILNEKKLDLSVHMTLFLKNPGDFNAYQLYKSYSSIISHLKEFKEKIEIPTPAELDHQIRFISDIMKGISTSANETKKTVQFQRGIMQSPNIGKSMYEIRSEQKGKFQAELKEGAGKYALCDAEYVPLVFIPMIRQIMDLTKSKLQIQLEEKLKQVQVATKAQRIKLGKPINQNNSHSTRKLKGKKNQNQHLLKPQEAEVQPIQLAGLDATINRSAKLEPIDSSSLPPTQALQDQRVLPQSAEIQLKIKDLELPPTSQEESSKQAELIPSSLATLQTPSVNQATQNQQSILSKQDGEIEQNDEIEQTLPKPAGKNEAVNDFDLEPWKKYTNKDNSSSKQSPLSEKAGQSTDPNIFILDEESSRVARIMLGLNKVDALEKVEMKDYVRLISDLGGFVLDKKKCVHFGARSLINSQWISVAMHRLHQDDPHIIPRNTPYWRIAKKLLIDIGLTEKLQS